MNKRLDELNQIGTEIRKSQSNEARTLMLSKAFKLLSDALKKIKKKSKDQEEKLEE